MSSRLFRFYSILKTIFKVTIFAQTGMSISFASSKVLFRLDSNFSFTASSILLEGANSIIFQATCFFQMIFSISSKSASSVNLNSVEIFFFKSFVFCRVASSFSELPCTRFVREDLCVFICFSINSLVALKSKVLLLSKECLSVDCSHYNLYFNNKLRCLFISSPTRAERIDSYTAVNRSPFSHHLYFTTCSYA